MANLYFDETLTACAVGDLITVSGDEGRHAVRVSRLRVGESTLIGNGRGLIASGVVSGVDRDRFTVQVESVTHAEAPAQRLVLVQALAKGDRDERAVEQATEFGVDAVQPWQAARSVSRWEGEKAHKGSAKWERIAREASKQSLRAWVPEVLPIVGIAELAQLAATANVVALHPRGGGRLSGWAPSPDRDTYLIVGPEGGFTDAELDTIEAAGGHVLVLGETVLRTSSAGPAALAVLNTALGRW